MSELHTNIEGTLICRAGNHGHEKLSNGLLDLEAHATPPPSHPPSQGVHVLYRSGSSSLKAKLKALGFYSFNSF